MEVDVRDTGCRESTLAAGERDMPISFALFGILLVMFQVFLSPECCQTELALFAHLRFH